MNVDVPPGVRPLRIDDPFSIGEYRLLGRLGIGGMGVVYQAYDPLARRTVAIKTLHPALADHAESRLRFKAERDFGRRVSSFCIPRVLDDGMDGPRPYIVTEYVKGASLAERVDTRGPLTCEALEAVAISVAAALVCIHAAGLAHRDLKPANVLLSPDGPRVIDFGIASDLEAAGGLTQSGIVMGSPGWIAPERLTGGPGSAASDIFGWGCLVAFAATGHSPFGSGSAAERSERILSGHPELTGLPEPWLGLIVRALDADPGVRPRAEDLLRTLLARRGRPPGPDAAAETVAELWSAAEAAGVTDPPSPSPAPTPTPTSAPASPPAHRRRTVVAWTITAVAVTAAVAAGLSGAAIPGSSAGPEDGSATRPATSPAGPGGPGQIRGTSGSGPVGTSRYPRPTPGKGASNDLPVNATTPLPGQGDPLPSPVVSVPSAAATHPSPVTTHPTPVATRKSKRPKPPNTHANNR
ncbi:protein kinase domain-containing protein [Actinomadura scrupuli]|uniref:serine/threonine-protein kinase n=1 Tax=Actinomadura scrupuli TaxID=559629 RepID=UPI003D99E356